MGGPEGNAIVYCEGAFGTTNGKTAHGLVRFTRRYRVLSVVDSRLAGRDAGEVLDSRRAGIPILATIGQAIESARSSGNEPTHLVVGIAPDGGRLDDRARGDVAQAIGAGLNVDAGLHDWLAEDPLLAGLARQQGVVLRDIRRPPDRSELHFFSGRIEEVDAARIATLGTDSAVGKRTTAWKLVDALNGAGTPATMVGTGQTAWLQGASHGIILDALVNDFVAGEIEHAVWAAWKDEDPAVIVVEGQGSLMNPAYPGGFEILAAARPQAVVLQHAPARKEYDGFPGYELHPLDWQILAIELVSNRPVVAVTVNHEGMSATEASEACVRIQLETGLPAVDPLIHGLDPVLQALAPYIGPGGTRTSAA
jgi:uncharacterized NAD-dependent epimerase/dehydratase family protein